MPVGRARGIVSFGIAGGLDPSFKTGTIVVARRVISRDATWSTDAAWSAALAEAVPGAIRADIAGSDLPVLTVSAKARLRVESGAAAVDTESHVAARAAAALGVRLAVFRVIADAADQSLPTAALVAVRADGTIDVGAVLRSISRSPGQISQLVRLGFDTRTALRALARGRERLGPGLRCPDLGELALDVT
jgi:nucleoside phosphorylase